MILEGIRAQKIAFQSGIVIKCPERKKWRNARVTVVMSYPHTRLAITKQGKDVIVGKAGVVVGDFLRFASGAYEHDTTAKCTECDKRFTYPGSAHHHIRVQVVDVFNSYFLEAVVLINKYAVRTCADQCFACCAECVCKKNLSCTGIDLRPFQLPIPNGEDFIAFSTYVDVILNFEESPECFLLLWWRQLGFN